MSIFEEYGALTDLFESLQVFLSWSEDVHVVLGLSSRYFFINFFHFFYLIFFFFFFFFAGLGGSVGCAVRLETRRSRVQPPPRSATFFRGD